MKDNYDITMTSILIKKLHAQTVERVTAELEKEADRKVKTAMGRSIAIMIREGILSRAEAISEAGRYGIKPTDISYSSCDVYDSAGCCSATPVRQTPGNRC